MNNRTMGQVNKEITEALVDLRKLGDEAQRLGFPEIGEVLISTIRKLYDQCYGTYSTRPQGLR